MIPLFMDLFHLVGTEIQSQPGGFGELIYARKNVGVNLYNPLTQSLKITVTHLSRRWGVCRFIN